MTYWQNVVRAPLSRLGNKARATTGRYAAHVFRTLRIDWCGAVQTQARSKNGKLCAWQTHANKTVESNTERCARHRCYNIFGHRSGAGCENSGILQQEGLLEDCLREQLASGTRRWTALARLQPVHTLVRDLLHGDCTDGARRIIGCCRATCNTQKFILPRRTTRDRVRLGPRNAASTDETGWNGLSTSRMVCSTLYRRQIQLNITGATLSRKEYRCHRCRIIDAQVQQDITLYEMLARFR